MPEAVQTFTDVDSYKAAKKRMLSYALATSEAPEIRYFRLIEQYKSKVHFWIINGGRDISPDHQYVLEAVGPVSEICIKIAERVNNLVIDGAVFSKSARVCFGCSKIEFRNCTWTGPEACVSVRRADKIIVTNPVGSAVIDSSGSSSTSGPAISLSRGGLSGLNNMGEALLLAKLLAMAH